jgi:propanol-preferring alcohol dehydrogenase
MRAARLHPGEHALRLVEVPVLEPTGDQVLVQVAGCGVCHSDLHVLDGLFDDQLRLPVTLGHEISGRVAAAGPDVSGVEIGEPVAVMVGWGCGFCRWCTEGREQLCPRGDEAGATRDGGFAEHVLVPHRRHVVPLGDLDPLTATPAGCAALCAYAAVLRVRPALRGGSQLVIIGAGGLGQFAIQLARTLTGATVTAVDPRAERRATARALGADHAVAGEVAEVRELTGGQGADAVIDFVGTDDTLALAARSVGRRGVVALLGLAGGSLPFGFYELAPEASLTTVVAGTVGDLREVVALLRAGRITSRITRYPLDRFADALADLRQGRIEGRAVLVP